MSNQGRQARIPVGVEKVLLAAAGDATLCEALLRDRLAVVTTLGIALKPGEAAILQSAPDATLRAMIAGIRVPDHRRRRFLQAVAAASAVAMVSCDENDSGGPVIDAGPESGLPLMDGGGARPDVDVDADLDAAADTGTVDASVLDDAGMSWGSRPEPDGG